MLNNTSISLRIAEASAAGEARRIAMELSKTLDFNPIKTGEVGIIVTELANNLWRHAGEGQILLRTVSASAPEKTASPNKGIEILSIDSGPGMPDVAKCVADGYSTGGSAGIGLGAVARLSSYSEIFSRRNEGTVALSQVWSGSFQKKIFSDQNFGAICVPVKTEQVCGDAWAEKTTEIGREIFLADGLGHGLCAASASDEGVRIFLENKVPAKQMVELLQRGLKSTVGAVIGLVKINAREQQLSFVGIGNLEGRIHHGSERRNLLSHNGTVGHTLTTVRQWDYLWQPGALLVLHSDGLSNKWDLENYPGLASRHPSIIAGVLYRDFRRERDDASVLVLREPSEPLEHT